VFLYAYICIMNDVGVQETLKFLENF